MIAVVRRNIMLSFKLPIDFFDKGTSRKTFFVSWPS